jgi:uncharacterized repeat protein (TIGR04076 family)
MAEYHKVSVKVVSQKGTCELGHKVGDRWVVDYETPKGLCIFAFSSLFPSLLALMFGGSFPWEKDPDVTTVACPDATNPVIFELRRLRE